MGRMGLMWGQFMGAGSIRIAASMVLVALLGIVRVGAFRKAQVALPEVGKMLQREGQPGRGARRQGHRGRSAGGRADRASASDEDPRQPAEDQPAQVPAAPGLSSRQAFIDISHRDFKRTIDAFARDERVFGFVADLDRCDVPRAADLMQAPSMLIADDSRVTFILGMDREKVAAGIAFKFKEVIPYLRPGASDADKTLEHLRYGREFLEEFLQIVFPLPSTSPKALQRFVLGFDAAAFETRRAPLREALPRASTICTIRSPPSPRCHRAKTAPTRAMGSMGVAFGNVWRRAPVAVSKMRVSAEPATASAAPSGENAAC